MGLRVWGLGFRVRGLGFRDQVDLRRSVLDAFPSRPAEPVQLLPSGKEKLTGVDADALAERLVGPRADVVDERALGLAAEESRQVLGVDPLEHGLEVVGPEDLRRRRPQESRSWGGRAPDMREGVPAKMLTA